RAGSALSVGGLQMQTLFRNPLAGPSVLGITSGASLGVAAVMLAGGSLTSIFAIQQLSAWGSWLIVGAASLGSAAVLLLILLISVKVRDNRSEEHTSELQSRFDLVCRLLLEKKNSRRRCETRARERLQERGWVCTHR